MSLLCLQMSRRVIPGFVSFTLQTREVARYNLNFLVFPQSAPFFFFFRLWHFRHSNLDDHRGLELSPLFFFLLSFFLPRPHFYSFYLAQTVTTAHAGTLMHRVHSSSLLLWRWGLRARPSECWRHRHLMCTAAGRRKGWWLCPPSPPPPPPRPHPSPSSPWHIMKIKSAGRLNYHIHLKRALSDVVLASGPNPAALPVANSPPDHSACHCSLDK